MDKFKEQKDSEIIQANKVGNDLKSFDLMGKEYYAFYNINGDTILEWIERKTEELVDTKGLYWSICGVVFDLTDKHVFKVSQRDSDLIYVNKKRFKRFIKKSVQRNISRG